MKLEYSKRVRALLRQLADTAYERELHGLLEDLEGSFGKWRVGELDTIALARAVDRFTRGPARRRLDERYETASIVHMNVAQAIVRNILRPDEVSQELLEVLRRPIEFYRRGLADGSVNFEEEPD